MSGVLQKYGVDPRELSQEQVYKLALILQLMQAQDKSGTVCELLPGRLPQITRQMILFK